MAGGSDNKSEKPTARKLHKAREKGQVVRSKEVPAAAVLLGSLLVLQYLGQTIFHTLAYQMRHLLDFSAQFQVHRLLDFSAVGNCVPPEITNSYLSGMISSAEWRVAIILGPVLLAAMLFSIAANMMQGGLAFSTESLGFHFSKLNPKNGMDRVFSKNGLVELGKSLLLVIACSIISYQVITSHLPIYPRLILMDVRKLLYWTVSISYDIFIRVAILLVVIAIVDYYFQKYRFTEQLKMTKQEVKEEVKESEGDPTTKGRIRRIQREMARKRMMADVPDADVVITNPTHYSVALSYKIESMEAPKVLAKGVGFLALKIRELAQEHGIPLVENKPLAQTLYKSVEIGEYIPGNLYKAVAEILAYVYKVKNAFPR
jgi:flagellar biosynthesis protein FlhB